MVARSDVEASQVGGSMLAFALHARPYGPPPLPLCMNNMPVHAILSV